MQRSTFARYYTALLLAFIGVLPLYGQWSTKATGLKPLTYAVINGISSPFAGSAYYCTDCTATSPCAGSGTGAFAYYTSAWNCSNGGGMSPSGTTEGATVQAQVFTNGITVGSGGVQGVMNVYSGDGTAVQVLVSAGAGTIPLDPLRTPNGSGNSVLDTSPTITNPTLTNPSISGATISTLAINGALSGSIVTAGTMTVVNSAIVRTVVHRFAWTNAMVTALGGVTAGDITVCTLPAGVVVKNAYIVIDTPDTSTNALTVALGRVSASYIDYIVASDAKGSANTVYGDASGERGTNLTGYDLPSPTGTTAVKAHFIKTTTNLNTVVGSTGHIYIETMTLP